MDPNVGLLAASWLASFLLKTTAEWLVFVLLVRVASSAKTRFGLWLAMLLGFVAQWVWMCVALVNAPANNANRTWEGTQMNLTMGGVTMTCTYGQTYTDGIFTLSCTVP